ncbi:right-handed parallel beta-helix repeat-containing protein [Ruminiclostridium cellulolyticum]|uniref:Parallel beta-helix repeat protein n=1 Tax=Ruminiclostridium cellulolyticum (strain ATCC 35319 / DSM 5812 / JCM 6584 / H10) TaxID=394503 RepID=B8I3L5_RUMCH|nr:right-handed parallel beta-helix repeat-containing protein [Ruminiclostridium cellulolyticum]ACL76358.1 Parallel beta-helix repeat protein [Ruminiclostridium cellulolyticum H10]
MSKLNKLFFSILIVLMAIGLIPVNSQKNIVYAETYNSTDTSVEADTIHVSGIISENTTWTNNYTYVVDGTIIVQQGVKLQIDQGVMVKFTRGTEIVVNGTLTASGTELDKVVFTSNNDTAYGGSEVTGYYDYWLGITVSSTGEFNGDYIKVRYAGADSNYYTPHCAINVQGKLNLTNSEVSNSKNYGIYLNTSFDSAIKNNNIISNRSTGIYINNTSADATNTMDIENNTISGNGGCGIYVSQAGTGNAVIEGNRIAGNGGSGIYIDIFGTGNLSVRNNNLLNNTESGIYVYLGGLSSSIFTGIADNTYEGNTIRGTLCNGVGIGGNTIVDITLSNAVYYLADFVLVPNDKKLTVQPGTIIKSSSKGSSIYVYGKLNALGTKGSPIVFTSHKDAAYGGSGIAGYYDYCDLSLIN